MERVYVAQGEGGLLKVGMTSNFNSRIAGLRTDFKKNGDNLARHALMAEVESARGPERLTVAFLAETCVPMGREWFQGASFDSAVERATALTLAQAAKEAYDRTPDGITAARLLVELQARPKLSRDDQRARIFHSFSSGYANRKADSLRRRDGWNRMVDVLCGHRGALATTSNTTASTAR